MAHNRILSQGTYTGGIKGYLGGEDTKKNKAFRNNYLSQNASHNVSRDNKSTRLRNPKNKHQISDDGYLSS